MAKGVALPDRLSHTASSFSLHSTSTVVVMYCLDTHSVFTAPPGAILSTTQVGIRVDSCHNKKKNKKKGKKKEQRGKTVKKGNHGKHMQNKKVKKEEKRRKNKKIKGKKERKM